MLECTVTPEWDRATIDSPGGPLPATRIRDANGNPRHHDETLEPGDEDAGFTCLRTWDEFSGVYVNRPRTCAPADSDFTLWPRRRIFSVGRKANVKFWIKQLSQGVQADKKTGCILERVAAAKEKAAKNLVAAAVQLGGSHPGASDVTVHASRTDNLLAANAEWNIELKIEPLAYLEKIKITNSMSNPATAG